MIFQRFQNTALGVLEDGYLKLLLEKAFNPKDLAAT